MDHLFETYHVTGLAVFNDHCACQFITPIIPDLVWSRHWDNTLQVVNQEKIELALQQTCDYVIERLSQYFVDIVCLNKELHNGIDTGTDKWHNDYKEGHNATVVVHFNSMVRGLGGEISVRNNTTNEQSTHYPQYGDVVIFSQKPDFDHIVGKLVNEQDRIAAFFDCILTP